MAANTLFKPVSENREIENLPNPETVSTVEKTILPAKQFKNGRTISFAFNDNSIEMAVISRFGKKIKIKDIRKVYIPDEILASEEKSLLVTNTVRAYLDEFGRRHSRITVCATGPETTFRIITLPKMKKKELRNAIGFEIKRLIPFPLEDCHIDYRIMARINRDGKDFYRLAIHAATKRFIKEITAPFETLGRNINFFYNAHDVIGQLLEELPFFKKDTNYALLNIGKSHSQISYFSGSNLVFYHVISLGSSLLSNRYDDAKFENFTELLAGEIQNSLDFYTGQFSSHFTNRIFVYGDMAYAEEIISLLSDHFGFEFSRFPCESLSFYRDEYAEYLYSLPACLQTLAGGTCTKKLANLLPVERQQAQKQKFIDKVSIAGLLLLAATFTYSWWLEKSQLTVAENYRSELEQKINAYKNSSEFITYNILKRQIAMDRSYLDKTQEVTSHLSLNLKELSLLTPKSIRLYFYDYHKGEDEENLSIYGMVKSASIPPEVILAEYVETLNHSPLFKNVTVTKHYKTRDKQEFELDFQLRMGALI
ncbi:MAG: pilus assembly protein PilM [Candidatus Zixiibacteriota bacterium]